MRKLATLLLATALAVGALTTMAAEGTGAKKARPTAPERAAARAKRIEARKKAAGAKKKRKKPRTPRVPANLRPAAPTNTADSIRLAVTDLTATFGERYPGGKAYLARMDDIERRAGGGADVKADLAQLAREATLANPLLDFDKILVLRRHFPKTAAKVMSASLGMPKLNAFASDRITNPADGWDNEIAVMTGLRNGGKITTLYKPKRKSIISDIDLHYDAGRMLFSSIGTNDRWHIIEMTADGRTLKQLTPRHLTDVNHYDACYLADDRIAFTSTAVFQGLPCIYGGSPMAVMYRMNADGSDIEQLTFEQDSDWCPTMLNNGRLMYLRWEYADTPHYFSRILFNCNPDGTSQAEYYGSNSFFPNAFFFARPIPGHSTRVIGVAGGHHGISRSGRLLLLDPALGRHEADGVVQEIPGRGRKVEPIIRDKLVDGIWPQFLHPYPLAEFDPAARRTTSSVSRYPGAGKYFLVSSKPAKDSLWGIYLVDVFDNMTLICESDGAALLEPVPFRKTQRPPVIPDRIIPGEKTGTLYLADIYYGPGLRNIPRGKVKALRVFAYHFNYNKSGGHDSVGVESCWDIRRILGTVPVESDGSALFSLPVNTPISMQPLDAGGAAIQLMRSWTIVRPGESASCLGCHEKQNDLAPIKMTLAGRRGPTPITPWRGPARPYAFDHEVQPVLDKFCAGCHDGKERKGRPMIPNFADTSPARDKTKGGRFSNAYMALHPYVRRPGPESDYHLLNPMEYHVNTSMLVQMLRKGHHNVKLDAEAWDRLATWIDLNAPYRGHWAPGEFLGGDQVKRRLDMAKLYANVDTDPESEFTKIASLFAKQDRPKAIMPPKTQPVEIVVPTVAGWPVDAETAAKRQAVGGPARRTVDLGKGVKLTLARVPAGKFVMGSTSAVTPADERPAAAVSIGKTFWIGTLEITNAQYKLFKPDHDSRYIDQQWKDHTTPGYTANLPQQPVIRVSWAEAMDFCKWLSEKTGKTFSLPTEAQWEYACRAGSAEAMSFGAVGADFSKHANLADESIKLLAVRGVNPRPLAGANSTMDFIPREAKYNDGQKIVCEVGQYAHNAWGLHDAHGNVAEWTRSNYAPYPYKADDGRNDLSATKQKVARGGSWRERPHRATASYRLPYETYQRVYNVGFRVVMEE